MLRRALLLSLIAALAGCGGSAAPAPDPRADRAAIQARVATYVGHLLAGDGTRACAQLTPEYRRRSDQRAEVGGAISCAEALSLYGATVEDVMPAGFARLAADPGRVVVSLRGDRAEAALQVPGVGPSIKRTSLRRVGSVWLIDGLGVTRPRR